MPRRRRRAGPALAILTVGLSLAVWAVLSRYGERYAIGHVHENGSDLFVAPGIGTSIVPLRFRVEPEISLITVGR